jgi:hypothetical protein
VTLSEADIEEFIAALQEDPHLRDRVRNAILADDFLALPGIVGRLSDDVRALVQESARQRGDIQAITAVVASIGDELKALAIEVRSQRGDIGRMNGRLHEFEYSRKLANKIGRHFAVEDRPVADYPPVVDACVDRRLSESDWDDLTLADVTVIGRPRRQADAPESVILIELSIVVDTDDVVRAARRAAIVRALGIPAIPCVDGEVITPQAVALAKDEGVMALVRKQTFP